MKSATIYVLDLPRGIYLLNRSNNITKPMGFVMFITKPIIARANLYDQINCFWCQIDYFTHYLSNVNEIRLGIK